MVESWMREQVMVGSVAKTAGWPENRPSGSTKWRERANGATRRGYGRRRRRTGVKTADQARASFA